MPRKRTGRVEHRNGKWIARIAKEYIGSFDTEEAAWRAIAAELVVEEETKDKRSFCVLGEAYMQEQEKLTRARRGDAHWFCKTEWSYWRRYVRTAPFYRKRVDKITRDEIKELLDRVMGSPAVRWNKRTKSYVPTGKLVGKSTGLKLRGRLGHFFKHCPGIKTNPALGVPFKKVDGVKRKKDADRKPHLHLDEIDRLFALPPDIFPPMLRAVYACGIWGGLRPAEIVGLEWPHLIRLFGKRPEIHIRKSYATDTKNESSQREIPMLPQLVTELRAYVESLGVRPVTGYVFPGPNGGMQRYGWDAKWYTKRRKNRPNDFVGLREHAKIRDHIEYRHIRHSFATHLLKGNYTNGHEWPLEKVSQFLGHAKVEMTVGHYASRDVDLLHAELAKAQSKKPR